MNYKELIRLVEIGENSTVEFKHKVNFPEKVAKEVVAFSNTRGGKILVGVDDNKNIYGIKNIEEEVFVIEKMIKDFVKFQIEYKLDFVKISDKKSVIVINISENEKKPNYAFDQIGQKYGKAFVRYKDQSIQASHEMLSILKLDKKERDYIFTFDNTSRDILKLLDLEGDLSKKSISEKLFLTLEKTSEMLIKMCVSKVIKILPNEKEDLFGVI